MLKWQSLSWKVQTIGFVMKFPVSKVVFTAFRNLGYTTAFDKKMAQTAKVRG